jgi:transcriptional regulator with PAS, ATPase and Fis domain
LVEEAHMGTLFLDEVGELTPQAQVKLLRFLQERSFRRVGDTTDRTVNVRIIAATNKDLPALVEEGTFREDLFYRLNVFYLHLPPLRYRRETIPNLIRLFVHRYNQLLDKDVNRITPAAEAILANYDYPGNVRELENIIEHAVVLSEGSEITERELPEFMLKGRLLLNAPRAGGRRAESPAEITTLQELEKQHIRNALRILDYNYTETAKRLGISRSTLWRKIKELDIEKT